MTARAIPTVAIGAVVTFVAACASVLGLRPSARRPFAHRDHALAGVSCLRCHPGVTQAGDEGPLHLPDSGVCVAAGCHSRPHDPRPCLGCHTTELAAAGALEARAHLRFEHARHVGPSFGNCVRCHVGVVEENGRLRPPMAVCGGCHAHQRTLRDRDCDACHVDLAEEGTWPESHLVHDEDFARRHGAIAAASADLCASCHTERFCASCHATVPAASAAPFAASGVSLRFDGDRPTAHRPSFRARHAEEARAGGSTCLACHAEASCGACHAHTGVAARAAGDPSRDPAGRRGVGPPVSPHPPGWVGPSRNDHGLAARRDPVACASCHSGAGEALCVGCHRVGGVGGNPHPPGFRSRLSLREAPCRLCHL